MKNISKIFKLFLSSLFRKVGKKPEKSVPFEAAAFAAGPKKNISELPSPKFKKKFFFFFAKLAGGKRSFPTRFAKQTQNASSKKVSGLFVEGKSFLLLPPPQPCLKKFEKISKIF